MKLPIDNRAKQIDPRIRKELYLATKRLRENKIYKANVRRLLIASGITVLILGIRTFWPALSGLAFPAVCAVVLFTLLTNFLSNFKIRPDFAEAARAVEAKFPELGNMLSTALEQKRTADGFNFLQEKVINDALHYSFYQYWEDTGKKRHGKLKLFQLGSLALIMSLAALVWYSKTQEQWIGAPSMPVLISSVEVTPGDTEAERGSAIVIAARFKGDFPRSATLVLQQDDGTTLRLPMAQSLSDPIFAYTLSSIEESAHYFIEYPGKETNSYRMEVYDLPTLVQADALFDYPDYTGFRDRVIEDTRRVSAVEGTRLTYRFLVNKPLVKAQLIDRDGNGIQLSPTNPERTTFETEIVLKESLRFHLHLLDEQDRENAYPPDLRIEVRENERPKLSLTFPKGDQAVSPIEELVLEAKANDDFGLVDYGMALAIGAESPEYLSLKSEDPDRLEAEFDRLYALEEEAVEVDQLVTWFAWAEDYDAAGESRRTLSDLFYAEVRPLEEIYREGEGGGGGQGGGQQGGPEGEILDQQRQIAIASFKLMQRGDGDSRFLEDTQVLHDSQQQIRLQLEQIKMELQEDRLITAANQAGTFMERAIEEFSNALDDESDKPLEEAWLAAQGAYQALLSMRPREMNVSQGRQQGGGGGGQNRNQRQLNQLDFKEDENRYETESQAQALTTPEERQQLEVLSKLSELARRQQQVNERLRELQTALAAAEDEEERDKIRRELKRLEEEQRQMITRMDEVQQNMDNLTQNRETRDASEQLQETREDMRNISESLQEEEVSQALAAGSRAQENLENLKEEFRESTSSQFAESMRQVRDAARELAENQRELSAELDELQNDQAPTLDGTGNRQEVADRYTEQRENLDNLLRDLREITEDSETGEPTLHRKLYDLLRKQNQSDAGENLEVAEELVRRGFLDQAQELQPGLQQSFNELEQAIADAASTVMGDETTALRFAQEELDELLDRLEEERPEGEELAQAGGQQAGQNGEENEQGQTSGQPGQNGEQQGSEPGEQQEGQASPSEGEQPGQLAQSQGQQPGQQEGGQQPGQQPGGQQPGGQQAGQQPGQQGGQQSGQQGGQGSQPSESLAQNESQQGQGNNPGGQQNQGGRQGGQQTAGGGGGGGNDLQNLQDILRSFRNNDGRWGGPITGDGFVDWDDRLRTIEELLELPEARQQLEQAREQAERMRADFKRHGNPPQWEDIDTSILKPIREVESWVQQELLRKEKPDTLQPVDRDPVPPKFANSVKKYYEALGGDS
jgi:hypothetical protein